jgi:hypothetical protein
VLFFFFFFFFFFLQILPPSQDINADDTVRKDEGQGSADGKLAVCVCVCAACIVSLSLSCTVLFYSYAIPFRSVSNHTVPFVRFIPLFLSFRLVPFEVNRIESSVRIDFVCLSIFKNLILNSHTHPISSVYVHFYFLFLQLFVSHHRTIFGRSNRQRGIRCCIRN